MSVRSWVFAKTYDRQLAKVEAAGLRAHRTALLAGARGRVLEVGGGTGANLAAYGPEVSSLTIVDPEPHMIRTLERRVDPHARPTTVLRAPAEDLPFPDDSFDVAVSTLVLCTVDDQPRALRELCRVLRPTGTLLFIEHVRAEDERLARWQDRLNGLTRFVMCGCNCNRPTLESLRRTGFVINHVQHTELPEAPPFVRPLVVGTATTPPSAGHPGADSLSPSASIPRG